MRPEYQRTMLVLFRDWQLAEVDRPSPTQNEIAQVDPKRSSAVAAFVTPAQSLSSQTT
jgi:hypothetical protein